MPHRYVVQQYHVAVIWSHSLSKIRLCLTTAALCRVWNPRGFLLCCVHDDLITWKGFSYYRELLHNLHNYTVLFNKSTVYSFLANEVYGANVFEGPVLVLLQKKTVQVDPANLLWGESLVTNGFPSHRACNKGLFVISLSLAWTSKFSRQSRELDNHLWK